MKLSFSLFLLAISHIAIAAPRLARRQSTDEVATVGYATLNGGTSGGAGGTVTTVTTLDELTSAVEGNDAKIVIVSGTITGDTVVEVGSNTSVLGASGATLQGVGLRVLGQTSVIIRNLIIQKVLADAGDAIGIQESSQVWVDHLDLSSDLDHDKPGNVTDLDILILSYDGLLDITHGCTGITVTNSYLHDHFKASLVGHSDSNRDQDTAITVTYANNYWQNLNSRTPSFRFGHGHIFNNVYEDNNDGINTRVGAQLLVENNVFSGTEEPLYSTDEGFAIANGNDFGGAENTAPEGDFTDPPYDYTLIDTASVRSRVVGEAGATLGFSA
ncbi:hypothetical protein ACEPAI_2550 [Sanghuangporus weigelae]